MFCTYCGKILPPNITNCVSCGQEQNDNLILIPHKKMLAELKRLRWMTISFFITIIAVFILNFVLSSPLFSFASISNTNPKPMIVLTPTPTPFRQTVTTSTHITKLQTGKGFDSSARTVQGETGTFMYGETVYIVFTVQTQDANAQVVLQLFQDNQLEDTTVPIIPQPPKSVNSEEVFIHIRGENRVEVDYNGIPEAAITFNIL